MIVDAFVERSNDGGATWQHVDNPWAPTFQDQHLEGPWAVPVAREMARTAFARVLQVVPRKHVAAQLVEATCFRVIDTDGIVVEQWPKRCAKS